MADLYPPLYPTRNHQSFHRHPESVSSQQQYSQITNPGLVYPSLMSSQHSGSSTASSEENHEQPPSSAKSPELLQQQQQQQPKPESKPQATFLTKLYA